MFRPHSYGRLPERLEIPKAIPLSKISTAYQPPGYELAVAISDDTKPFAKAPHTYSTVSPYEIGPEDYQSTSKPRFIDVFRRNETSWRFGARLAALVAATSLLINFTAGVWTLRNFGRESALVEVFRGDCQKVEKMSVWIHFLINLLSTALLSGSNYCMQCLSAPNRLEINAAHAKRKWLDIGVPSIRNLRNISPKKVALWWLLGLSSVPLHLMYNSAFFSSIATNDYNVIIARDSFVTGSLPPHRNNTIPGTWEGVGFDINEVQKNLADSQKLNASWETISNEQCIKAYGVDFTTSRRTVVVVVADEPGMGNWSVLAAAYNDFTGPDENFDPYSWICNGSSNFVEASNSEPYQLNFCYEYISQMAADAKNLDLWKPNGYQASYCLSEKVEGTCGFNVNLGIMLVVIFCNIGKLAVMLYVSFGDLFDPLITVGDAVSSFLDNPDPSTSAMCIATRHDIVVAKKERTWVNYGRQGAKLWQLQRDRWFGAASKSRWWTCVLLFFTALFVVGLLLWYACNTLQTGSAIKALWNLGFGQVHSETLISGWAIQNMESKSAAITASVLIANTPQALLSFLYLTLNGLLTSMFLSQEWSHFAHERKSLRVSNPRGEQRNTYFLQLPYRVAIPLMVLSGLLHWLVSQSIFLAVVAQYGEMGQLKKQVALATCGFSPFAMIFVMIVAGCLVIFALALGFRRFKPGMPLVGSCSAAIAAACNSFEPGAATKPLQWGAIPGEVSEHTLGHCCFSSHEVKEPVPGRAYAGPQLGKDKAA